MWQKVGTTEGDSDSASGPSLASASPWEVRLVRTNHPLALKKQKFYCMISFNSKKLVIIKLLTDRQIIYYNHMSYVFTFHCTIQGLAEDLCIALNQ